MRIVLASIFVLFATFGANAQDRGDLIKDTISGQIDALMQDDFATAFDFASPTIQRMFRDSQTFGQMVQRGYPMVWRPQDVQFLELRQDRGRLVQRILVTDQAGAAYVLDYFMLNTEKGWRINGVALLPDVGAST